MRQYLLKQDVLDEIENSIRCCDKYGDAVAADTLNTERTNLLGLTTYQMADERLEMAGEWLPVPRSMYFNPEFKLFRCSICDKQIEDRGGLYKFCPACGARMDG